MQPVLCFEVEGNLAAAEAMVRAALQAEGFGILTEVDVTATLKAKLGLDTRPYKILGACNPAIAHRAMEADARVGAFLPCGLALYEEPGGKTTVWDVQRSGVAFPPFRAFRFSTVQRRANKFFAAFALKVNQAHAVHRRLFVDLDRRPRLV